MREDALESLTSSKIVPSLNRSRVQLRWRRRTLSIPPGVPHPPPLEPQSGHTAVPAPSETQPPQYLKLLLLSTKSEVSSSHSPSLITLRLTPRVVLTSPSQWQRSGILCGFPRRTSSLCPRKIGSSTSGQPSIGMLCPDSNQIKRNTKCF